MKKCQVPWGGFFWLTMYISSFFWTTCVIVQPVDSTSHLLWLSEFHQWQDWQQCWLWYKWSTVNVTSHSWQSQYRQYSSTISEWDEPRQAVIRRTGTDENEHNSWHLGMVCTHLTATQTHTQRHTRPSAVNHSRHWHTCYQQSMADSSTVGGPLTEWLSMLYCVNIMIHWLHYQLLTAQHANKHHTLSVWSALSY